MDSPMMITRDELLEELKGQQVTIPNLYEVFQGWPGVAENPQWLGLREDCDRRLDSVYSADVRCKALKGSAFPYFTATWWPKANFEELGVLLYLTIWLFTWDDEIDEPDGSCSDDLDAASVYRAQTIEFVTHCLGFGSSTTPQPNNKIISSFYEWGVPIADAYSTAQRKRLLNELTRFLEHSKKEQAIRLSGRIPTIDEYWDFRMGTSAVGIAVACVEYANQSRICESVMDDPRIKAISDETIIIISIVNDLLSLKKEIAKAGIDSVVPIYCSQGMDVQDAINKAVNSFKASKDRFDQAADSLLSDAQKEPLKFKHVAEFIEGCQYYCLGNLAWSLVTGRYAVMNGIQATEDGSISFTL